MDLVKAIFELLQGLAWPGVVAWALWHYRDDIRKAFPRVKKAGFTGIELDQQTATRTSTFLAKGELKQFPPTMPRTPLMAKVEQSIHEALAVHKEEDYVDILARELAMTRISRACEGIWANIFQSQISALETIGTSGGSASSAKVKTLYDGVKEKLPEDFLFENWISFLVTSGLVELVGRSVKLTELGDDFLKWLPTKHPMKRSF